MLACFMLKFKCLKVLLLKKRMEVVISFIKILNKSRLMVNIIYQDRNMLLFYILVLVVFRNVAYHIFALCFPPRAILSQFLMRHPI